MRSIEQAYVETANGTFESSDTGERFSLRDEEKVKRIEKLRESKPIEITGNEYQGKYELNRGSAQRYLLDNLRGDYTIKDTGEVVSLAKKGAKKVTAHSMGNEVHLKSIAVIPQLIENSIFIEEQPAYKNDAKFDSYRYYVTGLKIGGEDYTARLTIGVKNGKSYYDHYLTHIEKGNLIDLINQSDSQDEGFKPTEGAPNTSDALSGGKDTKLLEILQTNRQENDEKVQYSLRQKPEPTKKGIGYKVFVLKDGKLYPPMVANPNGAETPVGVWLDADAAPIAGESKTRRPQVKQGGKGTQGGSGKLAYRPGWHLGVIPYALQFNRKDADGNKSLFPKNFVFAEVEYAADKDYQNEAHAEGINANGKYQHSLAGLKHLPTDGYYMYRTNPNPETDPWVITGAMKVNRLLTRAEQAELVRKAGREPQKIQDGDIVTDEVVNSINREIASAPKFSLRAKSDAYDEGAMKFSSRLQSAIDETETSPSDAQKESGNYKKGHVKFGGYDFTIENPKGSYRSGKDADGTEWKQKMNDTYGYIRGKFGKDGDHLDMFINDKADLDDWNGNVYVVDQVNKDGSFDEHKVMYGFDSEEDAKKAYLSNYEEGWQDLGNITGVSKETFDNWLNSSDRKTKPFAEYSSIKNADKFANIKPVGVGAFGNIYNQFKGKAKEAINFLRKIRGGEAADALYHHAIGNISLVWGDKKTGLDKILRKHPEVVDNLQSIIDGMEVVKETDNRVKLESPTHFAVVSKDYKGEPRGKWLLTAYEKRESLENGKIMDTATTSLGGDTALSQSKDSAANISNSSDTSKENGNKFSLREDESEKRVYSDKASVPTQQELGEGLSDEVKNYAPQAVPWNGVGKILFILGERL